MKLLLAVLEQSELDISQSFFRAHGGPSPLITYRIGPANSPRLAAAALARNDHMDREALEQNLDNYVVWSRRK